MFCKSFLKNRYKLKNVVGKLFAHAYSKTTPVPIKMAYNSFERTEIVSGASPIIILHGLFASKNQWRVVSKAIQENAVPRRKVIAVDARNHGESPHTMQHTYKHMAEDIAEFLRDHNIDKVVLMGHSMGGRACMYTALNYPNIIDRVIVVDTSPVGTPNNFLKLEKIFPVVKAIKIPNGLNLKQGREYVRRILKYTALSSSIIEFLVMSLKATEGDSSRFVWSQNIDALHNNFKDIAFFPKDEIKGLQYRGPVLFISGTRSDFLRTSDFDAIKTYFPKAEIQLVDTGHNIHLEYPSEFSKIVLSFLNEDKDK